MVGKDFTAWYIVSSFGCLESTTQLRTSRVSGLGCICSVVDGGLL